MRYLETKIIIFPQGVKGKQDVKIDFDKKGIVERMGIVHNCPNPINTDLRIENNDGFKILPLTPLLAFPMPNGNGGYVESMMPITIDRKNIVITFNFDKTTVQEEKYKLVFLLNTDDKALSQNSVNRSDLSCNF